MLGIGRDELGKSAASSPHHPMPTYASCMTRFDWQHKVALCHQRPDGCYVSPVAWRPLGPAVQEGRPCRIRGRSPMRKPAQPVVRTIGMADLRDSLSKGLADFEAMPTHLVFLCVIYLVLTLIFARNAAGYDVLPLV